MTLVCLRCNRNLHDWQLVANCDYCHACYQLNESDVEARRRVRDESVKDTLLILIILVMLGAASFLLLWDPMTPVLP